MSSGISRVILVVFLLLPLACRSGRPEQTKSLVGTTTPEGGLVFYEWSVGGQRRHVTLRDGYGMMIFYDVSAKNPKPRYELYIHKDKSIVKTTDPARFKRQLDRIPAGDKLHYYNTCAGGTHHGLDPDIIEDIRACCADKGIIFQEGDDELYGICTCP